MGKCIIFSIIAVLFINISSCSQDEKLTDLELYLQKIRDCGASEVGYTHIMSVANLLAGSIILSYQVDSLSGRYWPAYMSATCPNPNIDDSEFEQWKKLQLDKSEKIAQKLIPVADADASGFVTTEEGWEFRRLMEYGFLASQVMSGPDTTIEAVAKASGMDVDSVLKQHKEYQEASNRLYNMGVTDLPQIDEPKEE